MEVNGLWKKLSNISHLSTMKPTKNPWVLEKTQNTFERECSIADIPYIIREDGTKGCIWCGDDLKTKHPAQRYCKDKECPKSAYIWGYPQRMESLVYLMKQQNFKCAGCNFNYLRYLTLDITADSFYRYKTEIPLIKRPEVDHIIPICKGGQSLGIENHQILCYQCHKEKTKDDVKGDKRIKSPEEIQKNKDTKMMNKIYDKLRPFLEKYYTNDYQQNWKHYREIYLMTILSIEELECMVRVLEQNPPYNTNGFEELLWVKEALTKRQLP